MRNIALGCFLLFLAATHSLFPQDAQGNTAGNQASISTANTFHLSFGSAIEVNAAHFTYDRLIFRCTKGPFKTILASVKTGVVYEIGSDFSDVSHPVTLGLTGLTGKGLSHFEFGVGVLYTFGRPHYLAADDSNTGMALNMGYRKYWSSGLMFRAGAGISEWAYLGIGYGF